MELASPLIDQARGDNDQDRLNRPLNAQNPDCRDRLDSLSEPHIIGQEDPISREQRPDSVQLKLHEMRRPIERR